MALTRRTLLAGSAATAAVVATGTVFLDEIAEAATEVAAFVKGPPVPDRPLERISPHVFMIKAPDGFPTPENQGLMSNVTFVVGDRGVVVVDSGASVQIAEMSIRQLKKLTEKPVIGIVNTHYHGDHWLGNQGFLAAYGKDVPIHAHPGTRAAIEGTTGSFWHEAMVKWTNEATLGTEIVPPNHDIGHGFEIPLGDVTLRNRIAISARRALASFSSRTADARAAGPAMGPQARATSMSPRATASISRWAVSTGAGSTSPDRRWPRGTPSRPPADGLPRPWPSCCTNAAAERAA